MNSFKFLTVIFACLIIFRFTYASLFQISNTVMATKKRGAMQFLYRIVIGAAVRSASSVYLAVGGT